MIQELAVSLNKIINDSIEAEENGDKIKAAEYLKDFDAKKAEAISMAKEAAQKGNVILVDQIINSLQQAKNSYQNRKSNGNVNENTTTEKVDENVNHIIECYNQGNYSDAISKAKKLIEINPNNSTIWNILGLSHFHIGKLSEAKKILSEAAKKYPENFDIHNNLSVIYLENKSYKEGLITALNALKINPNSCEANSNVGNAYFQMQQFDEALPYYKKSITIDPQNPTLIINFAVCNLKLNNLEIAFKGAELALKHNPLNAEYLNIMGMIYKEMNVYEKSEIFYKKSIEQNPKAPQTLNNYGLLLLEEARYLEAIKCFNQAIKLNPKFLLPYSNIATCYIHLGEIKQSLAYLNKSIKVDPKFDIAHHIKGVIAAQKGNNKEALKNYNITANLNPYNTENHRQISRLTKYSLGENHISQMEKIYDSPLLGGEKKAILCFALGKAYEDMNNSEKSFDYYKRGNDFFHQKYKLPLIREEVFFRDLIKTSHKDIDDNKKVPQKYKQPIFVVGLPRSGTSLVEQILSSHSLVEGLGELNLLGNYIQDELISYKEGFIPKIKSFDVSEQQQLMNNYMNHLPRLSENKLFFVDKMPHNFRWLSYILKSMPFAKIVIMERSPQDNCFSLYKMLFSSRRHHSYCFNLEILGEYYLIYKNIINHWKKIYKSNVHICSYENLVSNPKEEIQSLIKYCNLGWEDKLMNFHKTQRIVSTASHSQVREKLYSSSIGSWKKFEKELSPLLEIIK